MSFPTSYIKTEGSQVTRLADNASVDDLSGWFNGSEFTWLIDLESYDLLEQGAVNNYLLSISGRSFEFRLNNSTGVVAYVSGAVVGVGVNTVGISNGKIAISYKAGQSLKVGHNGGVIYQNEANYDPIPFIGSVSIDGKRNDSVLTNFNAFIRKADIVIPRALTTTELEALTS